MCSGEKAISEFDITLSYIPGDKIPSKEHIFK